MQFQQADISPCITVIGWDFFTLNRLVNQMDWWSWANPSPILPVHSAPSFECTVRISTILSGIAFFIGNKSHNMPVTFAGRRNIIYMFLRNRPKQSSPPLGCFVSTWNIFHRESCDVFLSEVVHIAHQTSESFHFQAKVSGFYLSNPALVKLGKLSRFFKHECCWLMWCCRHPEKNKNLIIIIMKAACYNVIFSL